MAALLPLTAGGADRDARMISSVLAAREARDAEVARQVWEWAEVGFQETQSSALLQQELREAGFAIEAGVAGMPTAFVASYGAGAPVIGIFAEMDALTAIDLYRKPAQRRQKGTFLFSFSDDCAPRASHTRGAQKRKIGMSPSTTGSRSRGCGPGY